MSDRPPSLRLLIRAVLVVAALVSLSACGHQRVVPDEYGETTQNNFMEGCVFEMTAKDGDGTTYGTKDAENVCTCSYNAITKEIPFEEFKTINSKLEEEPTELPDEIQTLVTKCVDEQDKASSPS